MGFFTRSKARKRGGADRPRGSLDVGLSARDRTTPEAPAGRSDTDAPARRNPKSRSAKKGGAKKGGKKR